MTRSIRLIFAAVVLVTFAGASLGRAAAPAAGLTDVNTPDPVKLARQAYAVYQEHAHKPLWKYGGVDLLAAIGLVEVLNGNRDLGRERFAAAEALAAADELHRRLPARLVIARFQSAAGLADGALATLRRGVDELEKAHKEGARKDRQISEFSVRALRMFARLEADDDVNRLLKLYQAPEKVGDRMVRWPHCEVAWAVELFRRGEKDRARTMLAAIADAAPEGDGLVAMVLAVAYSQIEDDDSMRRQLDKFDRAFKDPPTSDMNYIACIRTMLLQGRRDEALKLWENRPGKSEVRPGTALRYAMEIGDAAGAAALAREKPAPARAESLLTVAGMAFRTRQREAAEALVKEVETLRQTTPEQGAKRDRNDFHLARARLAAGDFNAPSAFAESTADPVLKAFAYAMTALEVQIRRGAKIKNIFADGEYNPFSIEE